MATIEDFEKLDIRVGKIIKVDPFPKARKPAYQLTIDFGPEIGIKRSSGQFTHVHWPEELIDTQVICVVNFPPRQVGPFISEVLTLGVPDENGNWVIMHPAKEVPVGGKLG